MPLAPEAEGKRPALEPSGPGKAGRTGRTHLRARPGGRVSARRRASRHRCYVLICSDMDSLVVWLQSGLENSDSTPRPVSLALNQSHNYDTANPSKSYESPPQKPQRADKQRISDDPVRLISAATVFRGRHGARTRLGEAGGSELDLWLPKAGVAIVAVEAEHADQARRAWRRYGKGPSFRSISRTTFPMHSPC